jgi:hypothetical protein
MSVSNRTIFRKRPNPVKKALAWRERLLPSIASILRVGKSVRSASAKRRSRNAPSGSGVNLLKSGMITAGAMSSRSN